MARDAVRDGDGEVSADGGVPGTELVRGWWHKDVVGFGEEPYLKQNQTLVIWDVFEGWWEHLGSSTSRDSTGKMPPISGKCSQ